MNIVNYLKGKKSYIVGIGLIATAVYSKYVGYGVPTEEIFLAGLGLLGITLRAGIKSLAETEARPTGKN